VAHANLRRVFGKPPAAEGRRCVLCGLPALSALSALSADRQATGRRAGRVKHILTYETTPLLINMVILFLQSE